MDTSISEIKACSHDRNTQIFPLFDRQDESGLLGAQSIPNIDPPFLPEMAQRLGLSPDASTCEVGHDGELTALRLFSYVYAILHPPGYRQRYFEFLRSDFPRIPVPADTELFRSLANVGGELISLHLLESENAQSSLASYTGPANPEVRRIRWAEDTVWLDAPATATGARTNPGLAGFRGVAEDVWNFQVGGYQMCHKWLKDRKGATLSGAEIDHYERMVSAIAETINRMVLIDTLIGAHGGWPAAFAES
jgi:hypothetical protein